MTHIGVLTSKDYSRASTVALPGSGTDGVVQGERRGKRSSAYRNGGEVLDVGVTSGVKNEKVTPH